MAKAVEIPILTSDVLRAGDRALERCVKGLRRDRESTFLTDPVFWVFAAIFLVGYLAFTLYDRSEDRPGVMPSPDLLREIELNNKLDEKLLRQMEETNNAKSERDWKRTTREKAERE
jgi:hypothetical protein